PQRGGASPRRCRGIHRQRGGESIRPGGLTMYGQPISMKQIMLINRLLNERAYDPEEVYQWKAKRHMANATKFTMTRFQASKFITYLKGLPLKPGKGVRT